jgi:hypothetical protein
MNSEVVVLIQSIVAGCQPGCKLRLDGAEGRVLARDAVVALRGDLAGSGGRTGDDLSGPSDPLVRDDILLRVLDVQQGREVRSQPLRHGAGLNFLGVVPVLLSLGATVALDHKERGRVVADVVGLRDLGLVGHPALMLLGVDALVDDSLDQAIDGGITTQADLMMLDPQILALHGVAAQPMVTTVVVLRGTALNVDGILKLEELAQALKLVRVDLPMGRGHKRSLAQR